MRLTHCAFCFCYCHNSGFVSVLLLDLMHTVIDGFLIGILPSVTCYDTCYAGFSFVFVALC